MRAQMLGAALRGNRLGGAIVSISNQEITSIQFAPTAATATLTLESDGGNWLIGSTNGAAYECLATETSGSLTNNPAGAWIALSADRTFRVTRSSLGSKTCTFTLEIGLLGTSTALDTASITLTATVEP